MPAEPARPWRRRVAIASSGRHLAFVDGTGDGGVALVDAFGIAQRQLVPGANVVDFAFVGDALWLVERDQLRRVPIEARGAREPLAPTPLTSAATGLAPFAGDRAFAAVIHGEVPSYASVVGGRCTLEPIATADGERVFPTLARRVVIADARGVRVAELGRTAGRSFALAMPGRVLDAMSLFAGRAIGVLVRGDTQDSFVVIKPDGAVIHRVAVPRLACWSVGATRGIALACVAPDVLLAIDLRYGRVSARTNVPWPLADLGIDDDGQYAVLAGELADGAPGPAPIVHAATTDLFASALHGRGLTHHVAPDDDDAPASEVGDHVASIPELGVGQLMNHAPTPRRVDAAALPDVGDASEGSDASTATRAPPDPDAVGESPAPIIVPDLVPIAFGVQPTAIDATADPEWPPYESAHDHLEEMLDLTAARAARAIAIAWHSGLLSVPAEDQRPFEREVRALLGHVGGYAPDQLDEADTRFARASARTAGRARSTIAAGRRLPFVDLVREFGLSSTAAQVLVVAAAPRIRGQIARLFGILGNDPNRPIVDRYLVEAVMGANDPHRVAEVARELADDAPLVAFGLVRIGVGELGASLFGGIAVDPVLIERIRGRTAPLAIGQVTIVRHAERTLDELLVPLAIKRDLVRALAAARPAAAPLRLVIKGRRGAGRHSVIAALAAGVGRGIACIDCLRLPRAGKLMASALRQELFRALLRGCVPVVSGVEVADPSDAEGLDQLKQVLRAHPGPIVIRAAPEASLPIDPGYVAVVLPPQSESERAAFWRRAAARAQLPIDDIDALAARYRVGPGIVEHVVAQVASRRTTDGVEAGADAGAELDEVAAQHIATRLSHVAKHITRRARFEQVALPDDVLDSIREFVARSTYRRTVYERWGFDAKMASSRGLSALFYGPPGTGKSMVAGLIARELGLELYRVDLARVVSKWIGETEKNLAEVFDAAEDGQVVVLFDEADSLFAKRTEVKSSVDRYANLEVNYLLQRLDTFEGICILTTNLEGSIDPAFKRRMSLRLQFPFPDEDTRIRLWAAHIPPEAPVQGDFDFAELARRFPISGGYIRNSTLRAAFLAAQEDRPLGQSHLLRAIALEYRELGKLSTSGRME